jgi:protein-L-isoaspartate(D-aspartate) O-methyltransferase
LARLGYDNVRVHLDDGSLGLVREAPFDAIICTAGAEFLPTAYQDQLADGGRLVIPIGRHGHQQMFRFTRRGDNWYGDRLGSFGFVPLVSGDG